MQLENQKKCLKFLIAKPVYLTSEGRIDECVVRMFFGLPKINQAWNANGSVKMREGETTERKFVLGFPRARIHQFYFQNSK